MTARAWASTSALTAKACDGSNPSSVLVAATSLSPSAEPWAAPLSQRVTLAAHRPPRGGGVKRSDPHPEERAIIEAAPETALYVAALKRSEEHTSELQSLRHLVCRL